MPNPSQHQTLPIAGKKRRTLFPETPGVHIGLFFTTIVTVMFAYLFFWGGQAYTLKGAILEALVFASGLLTILLSHELGHYLAAKYHNIDSTLPYFIPAPVGIGTFGAFIQIKGKLQNRRHLMDVGAAGPLAGLVMAVILAVAGISQSQFMPVAGADLILGDPLILKGLVLLIKGYPPEGMDLALSPMVFAAWIGFLITALNLMPASQLDGGHIVYALVGKKHRIISRLVFLSLILWGVWGDIALLGIKGLPTGITLTVFAFYLIFLRQKHKIHNIALISLIVAHIVLIVSLEVSSNTSMWLFWGGMLFFFQLDHPPVVSEIKRHLEGEGPVDSLDRRRILIGIFTMIVFIVTFMPQPIKILVE